MGQLLTIIRLFFPLAIIAAGFLAGRIFEAIILARLKKFIARTKWEGSSVIVSSLRGLTTIWFVLLGVHIAIPYVKVAPHIISTVQKVLTVAIILSATVALARIAAGLAGLYSRKTGAILSASMFTNLTKLVVFIVGALIILQSLGISITPILTALGVGGLAVALALQETLSNLFAGLDVIASRQIRIGDYVKLSDNGEEGYVEDITWRNTAIRTLPSNIVIVPNSKLASAIVTNYYLPQKEIAVLVQVGVSYDSDLEKVEKVTVEVAKEIMNEVPGGVPEFQPVIRYHTFADFSINFTVVLRGKEFVDQHLIKHEFIKRLHTRYQKEGIVIPFPIRTVYTQQK